LPTNANRFSGKPSTRICLTNDEIVVYVMIHFPRSTPTSVVK
jgi:hypothetical protein